MKQSPPPAKVQRPQVQRLLLSSSQTEALAPKIRAPAGKPCPHPKRCTGHLPCRGKRLINQSRVALFCAVARLVSRDEVARTPKAKAALDAEWERLKVKGTCDEARVQECRKVVSEANRKGETVHFGRIFEACYEKGSELEEWNPLRKFKGRTATMSEIKTLTMPCLASSAQALRQWKPPRFSTPTVASQVLANSRRTPFKLMSRPSSQGCPPGYLFHEIGGRRPGRANTKTLWYTPCISTLRTSRQRWDLGKAPQQSVALQI